DRFKLALTGASRALAHEPEVEVAWSADAPTVRGKHFRVPLPGRSVPTDQAREARGFADSFSLKLRHHDEAMHARAMPPEPTAGEGLERHERVRDEALCANNYGRIRANHDAATELRTNSDPIARAIRPEDVPVASALGLTLREKLTGEPIPQRAAAGVEMVRAF